MTYTASTTYSYTTSDIEVVIRRFTADIVMIAQSSAAISEDTARAWAHDVEELSKRGYLKQVDITLLSNGVEIQAAQYVVNTSAGDLTASRPGNAKWPRVATPHLRIVISYTASYTPAAEAAMKGRLKINWTPTIDDISHRTLKASGGRDYASNGWGLQRKDFTQ